MKTTLGQELKIKLGMETEKEKKERVARERKENEKLTEYFQKIQNKTKPELSKLTTAQFKNIFWFEGQKYFDKMNRDFVIDKSNKTFLNLICQYFAGDIAFEKSTNGELRKGLLIYGPCGTGKSSVFDIIQNICKQYNLMQFWFTNISVHEVVSEFNVETNKNKSLGGEAIIQKYSKGKVHFDDLGTEKQVQAWGIKENLFDKILQLRYNEFKTKGTKTFVTTNLSIKEIEKKYCKQVKDRLYEMFNFIELTGNSRRF